jgi:hypothetical protein
VDIKGGTVNVTVPLASARERLRLSLSLPIGSSLYGTVSCATTAFTAIYSNAAILASWRLTVIPLVVTGIQFDCHTSLDFCSYCLCIAEDLVRIEYVACSHLELHGGIALKARLVVTREQMRAYISSHPNRARSLVQQHLDIVQTMFEDVAQARCIQR